MNSTLFMGIAIAQFDREIFDKLRLRKTKQECVGQEPLRIGIRNEFGEIYRMVGISKLRHFEKISKLLNDMGFVNELPQTGATTNNYSAIFDNAVRRKQYARNAADRSFLYSDPR